MSQSEFEAIRCDPREARENVCVQVAIGFGFFGWKSGASFAGQSLSTEADAKPKETQFTFDTQLTALT